MREMEPADEPSEVELGQKELKPAVEAGSRLFNQRQESEGDVARPAFASHLFVSTASIFAVVAAIALVAAMVAVVRDGAQPPAVN
jgi:hypothetical protein